MLHNLDDEHSNSTQVASSLKCDIGVDGVHTSTVERHQSACHSAGSVSRLPSTKPSRSPAARQSCSSRAKASKPGP